MFADEAGNKFRFMNGVDGPPRYSILNYQKADDGSYRWHVVGNYTRELILAHLSAALSFLFFSILISI